MKLKQLIEMVQQHHPKMGETEIKKYLNLAKDDYCEQTNIYKKTDTSITTSDGTRWYTIPSDLMQIEEVYYNDVRIPRLQGNPKINDES